MLATEARCAGHRIEDRETEGQPQSLPLPVPQTGSGHPERAAQQEGAERVQRQPHAGPRRGHREAQ